MTFQHKVILVTGGSSGIGLATAQAFAHTGAHVWLVARNAERLTAALSSVREACAHRDQQCGMIAADLADPAQAAGSVEQVTQLAGLPDIIVNSHGVTRPGLITDVDVAAFRELMDINFFGALHVIKAALPGMIARRSGHIVNIASGAALVPVFGLAAYAASKHALCGLSDVLRLELKQHNIRVSVVYPPDTDTPMLAWETNYRPPEAQAVYGGTVVSADYVARAILDGVARGHYSITPSFEVSAASRLAGLLGDRQFAVLDRLIARAQRKHESTDAARG
jgi:3-dehydrosphinganine reductase